MIIVLIMKTVYFMAIKGAAARIRERASVPGLFILYTAAVGLVILLISIIELSSGINMFTQQPLTF